VSDGVLSNPAVPRGLIDAAHRAFWFHSSAPAFLYLLVALRGPN